MKTAILALVLLAGTSWQLEQGIVTANTQEVLFTDADYAEAQLRTENVTAEPKIITQRF